MSKQYTTKDSGKRVSFDSGMQRDIQEGKPRYDLMLPAGQAYQNSSLYRWAMLMARGAEKYGERNWEKANSQNELDRFKGSAFRHFMQWYHNEDDEDHLSAVYFNLNAYEFVKQKLDKNKGGTRKCQKEDQRVQRTSLKKRL